MSKASFLFMVIEATPEYRMQSNRHGDHGSQNELESQSEPTCDSWGNPCPPTPGTLFSTVESKYVFRYHHGKVTPAKGYKFDRDENHNGMLWTSLGGQLPWLRVGSVFSCGAHLPIVVAQADPTVHDTVILNSPMPSSLFGINMWAADDDVRATPGPSVEGDGEDGRRSPSIQEPPPYLTWTLLHFSAHPDIEGLSLVRANARGEPHVVGKHPSWVPSLVPPSYLNDDVRHRPASAGLAGELAILIGLMAFHNLPGKPYKVFENEEWDNNKWRRMNKTPAYPKYGESCRGYVTWIFPDDQNLRHSTAASLAELEMSRALVKES